MTESKTDLISVTASPPRLFSPPVSCNRGFSLIEVISAIAILAVLAMLSAPTVSKLQSRTREVRCMKEIRDLEKVIAVQFSEKGGALPASWEQVGMEPPLDPWGRAYVIRAPFRKDITFINGDYDLYSTGADGLTAQDIADAESLDDVLRAGDGGFVGLVENILF